MNRLAVMALAVGTCLIAPSVFAIERRAAPREPAMSPEVREMLEAMLDESQMEAAMATLSSPKAWGTLGPHPRGEREPVPVDRPGRQIDLEIPADAEGTGTADDPYVNVISGFLARFDYEPPSRGTFRVREYSYPEAGTVEGYVAALDYERTLVRVPAGHYRETQLDVPPAIWLKADGDVALEPDVEAEENTPLVDLNIRAGLVGFALDGSNIPDFELDPPMRVTAVQAAHEAVVADNHIRRFTGHGITAAGGRGRMGSDVTVWSNVVEWVGYSGIRGQSRWNIRHNQVRYAGVLRHTSVGDDGIIAGSGVRAEVANNLVILAQKPRGRHAISGQRPYHCLVAGNISIAEGTVRNNIGFSDGAHRNWFLGNLILGTGESERRGQRGISVSGYGNLLERNVSIGNPRGYRANGPDERPSNLIWQNYAEYSYAGSSDAGIHRSRNYQAIDNTFEAGEGDPFVSTVESVDPRRFGLFGGERK